MNGSHSRESCLGELFWSLAEWPAPLALAASGGRDLRDLALLSGYFRLVSAFFGDRRRVNRELQYPSLRSRAQIKVLTSAEYQRRVGHTLNNREFLMCARMEAWRRAPLFGQNQLHRPEYFDDHSRYEAPG